MNGMMPASPSEIYIFLSGRASWPLFFSGGFNITKSFLAAATERIFSSSRPKVAYRGDAYEVYRKADASGSLDSALGGEHKYQALKRYKNHARRLLSPNNDV